MTILQRLAATEVHAKATQQVGIAVFTHTTVSNKMNTLPFILK